MIRGRIEKALSGFYYVDDGSSITMCRARGKFRHQKISPLVGDRVLFTRLDSTQGAVDEILPRKYSEEGGGSMCGKDNRLYGRL